VDSTGFAQKRLGLLDRSGKEIAPLVYQFIGGFKDGLAVFYRDREDYWGYINQQGKEVTSFQYTQADDFSEGRGRVEAHNQFGFVNKEGKEIIRAQFDYASDFKDGFSLVAAKGSYGILNREGKLVIAPRYEAISRQPHSIIHTQNGKVKQQALLSKQGELLIAPGTYDSIQYVIAGVYQIRHENKLGYYNQNLKTLFLPIEYDSIRYVNAQIFQVKYDGKWGLINRDNKVILPLIYQKLNFPETGLVRAIREKLDSYLISKDGEILVQPDDYQEINEFQEGLARVRKNGKFGYINQQGQLTIPLSFSQAADFYKGTARVIQDGQVRTINQKGKFVKPSPAKKDAQ
ncbi:MAG: WG repeat-containing protein, partial [Bacteroidota bacterium]